MFAPPVPARRRWGPLVGLVGFSLAVYGVFSAVYSASPIWYSFFTSGGVLLLGFLNAQLENESILTRLAARRREVVETYLLYLIATFPIEWIGRYLLHLWVYPYFDSLDIAIHVFLIGYPLGMFVVYETFVLISRGRPLLFAIGATTILSAFLHEIPNLFAWEWRYTIPYVRFEILRINIVVIAGWLILVLIPLGVRAVLTGKSRPVLRHGA